MLKRYRNTTRIGLMGVAAAMLLPLASAHAQTASDTIRFGTASLAPGFGRPEQGTASPSVYSMWPFYDSLTMVSPKGEVSGLLAAAWENVDPNTWRFTLAKGVKFHNGKELTADHVAAQFTYLVEDADAAGTVAKSTNERQAFVASARAIDSHTVEFTTTQPNPELARQLAGFWIPETDARRDLGTVEFAKAPVGTGPYMNPQYSGGTDGEINAVAFRDGLRKPHIGNLRVIALQEAASRVAALVSDQVDIVQGVPFDAKDQIEAAGHRVDFADRPSVLGWRFMAVRDSSPFKDKRVRQAANYAIDRVSMARDLLGGTSVPGGQCATQNTFGYNPDVKPYPYDPAKAKALLKDAGFENGFETEAMIIPGSFPADNEIYQLAAAQLSAVGIRTTLTVITFSQWLDMWFGRKKAPDGTMGFSDIFSNACHNFNAIPFDAYPNLTCKKELPSNCNEEETALLDKAMGEFDLEKRRKLIQDLMAFNHDHAPNLFFVELTDLTGVNKRVQGFANTIQRFSFHDITFN